MVDVTNLVKTYDGVRALDRVNLHVKKGSVYGLVGPNGAGKSTLIRHLCGISRQDSGSVTVDGAPVYENTAVKARIAYVSDDSYYFVQASTRDMMRFYSGLYPKFDRDRYEKLKAVFKSIDDKQSIRRLSKGMQKQVALWLALCCRPELILLDEPVDGLDPMMRRLTWRLMMSEVAEHGTSVLVSSHNLRELEDVCDHLGVMNKGAMVLENNVDALQENLTKVQLVTAGEALPVLPPELQVLHQTQSGRLITAVIRGSQAEVRARLTALSPTYLEALPLTLEEVFIYELGGEEHELKDILL